MDYNVSKYWRGGCHGGFKHPKDDGVLENGGILGGSLKYKEQF